jgi:hypothetical protein
MSGRYTVWIIKSGNIKSVMPLSFPHSKDGFASISAEKTIFVRECHFDRAIASGEIITATAPPWRTITINRPKVFSIKV